MITLDDHQGDKPVLRLAPAKPLAERERDAAKKRQQDEQLEQMLAELEDPAKWGRGVGWTDGARWQPEYAAPEANVLPPRVLCRETIARKALELMFPTDPTKADCTILHDPEDDGA